MSSNTQLKKHIDRIENLESTIKDHNQEKSDIYKQAKGEGYDPKIIKKVIAIRKNGLHKHEEEEELIATYMAQI